MTDPERLQCELTHLLGLCRPPLTVNWRPYCRAKAKAMAAKEPAVFADLPRLLEAGLRDLSKSTLQVRSTNEPEKGE